jgi:hypothetical protein
MMKVKGYERGLAVIPNNELQLETWFLEENARHNSPILAPASNLLRFAPKYHYHIFSKDN